MFDSVPTAPEPSSTSLPSPSHGQARQALHEAELEVARLARNAQSEIFEDGIDNEVSASIEALIARFGSSLVDAISAQYLFGQLPRNVMAECLRWLGRVDHPLSRNSRFWFLVYCLRDDDSTVRSASALGLASLEEVRAVPYLNRAAESEPIDLLKARIGKVADELAP